MVATAAGIKALPEREVEPVTTVEIGHLGTKKPAFMVVVTKEPATQESTLDNNIREPGEDSRCRQVSPNSKQTPSNSTKAGCIMFSPLAVVEGTRNSNNEPPCQ